MPVTPKVAPIVQIPSAGGPVNAVPPNPVGGFIVNPLSAADQGLAGGALPEPLYVSPAGAAGLAAGGTTFALAPGQKWDIIPGQTTATSVNALTTGHKFSAVYW